MNVRKQWSSWAVMAASLALGVQSPNVGRAQDAQVVPASQNSQAANDQDPPTRAARLNFVQGAVSFQPGGESDWVTAVLNRPLMTGDNLWADEDSRAEVHIGSTALRLGPKTGITLLEVSDRAAQIRLAEGSLIVKIRHVDEEDSYEVDTPNVAFVVSQPGDYRIDVNPDGSRTEVTVWRGRGQVTGGGASYTVVAAQHATFTGTDSLNYDLAQLPAGDGFDQWGFERDRNEDASDSANYVSREMTGYEDLDQYGDWTYVADYGMCWRPRVLVAEWAPYRFGHWAWLGPWGWTWVADEPWGFAPFHYGRWAFAEAGWFWVPGSGAVRPVYAPALVAWLGGGAGFNFSFGAGVGWFPLAPGEVFIPGYRVSRTYVNRVNTTNTAVSVTKITNVYNTVVVNRNPTGNNVAYANRGVGGGVTVVSHETFVNARPVARNVMPVPAKELAAATVSQKIGVEPAKNSVFGAGPPVANRPPVAVTSRQVVALRTPAPMPREFDQRQAQAGGQRAHEASTQQAPTPRSSTPQSSTQQSFAQQSLVRQQAPGRPATTTQVPPTAQSQDGFRSFGQSDDGSHLSKSQPRVWEAQGTPEPPEGHQSPQTQSERRNVQPSGDSRQVQPGEQPPSRWSHPLAKPVAPVQTRTDEQHKEQQKEQEEKFSNWHQQKPASPSPQRQQNSHPPASSHESAPKKGR